jgi:hypothetical protein
MNYKRFRRLYRLGNLQISTPATQPGEIRSRAPVRRAEWPGDIWTMDRKNSSHGLCSIRNLDKHQ